MIRDFSGYFSMFLSSVIRKVMSAPNLFRVGTTEKIFVECQDCVDNNDFNVVIKVMNYPSKSLILDEKSVNLNKTNKFQSLAEITVPATDFSKDPTMKQYVYLQATFPGAELEKIVLVSFQSGYIFIQTDKTLYTPNSVVQYRMFGVKPSMEPVENDKETNAPPSIDIEIVTPNKITLPIAVKSLESGLYTHSYQLGDIVSPGLWTLVARFHDNPQESFTAEFEVKEYVLPSFEVKLSPDVPFFHVDSSEFTVSISAVYLFGQEVSGVAYVIFGVEHDGQKKSFPSSIQRKHIENGKAVGELKKEHITEVFQDILGLVGSSVYVSVSVLTENGGEMVEAQLKDIRIVTSPYSINFKKTSRYFKPGMPFDAVVEVTNPDGTPARGINVLLEAVPYETTGKTTANGIARLSINTKSEPEPLIIQAKTNVPGITQASATMTATPYTTSNGQYIYIGLGSDEVRLGDNLKVTLNLKEPINAKYDITYLILSKGQLVNHGRIAPRPVISLTVFVTKDMLPSFRIVAYYHTNANEVVSDSVWVDVEDTCMGSLKLEPAPHSYPFAPRGTFKFKVIGDPGATVGLVAVDKGVYVLNTKHRLSQKKIWDMVETYDTGCTPGGGRDAMHVFHDAGLLFKTNLAPGSPYRQETKCPVPSRRKRASTIMDVKTSLVSQYEEKIQRDCCLDGMRDTPLSYDCERRSEYIVEGAACVEAFLRCCKELKDQQDERRQDSLLLARSEEEENSDMDTSEIVSRSSFPESWMWYNIKLPPCPGHNPKCETQESPLSEMLKDSITTWQLTAISLSATHSICVADPLEVKVQKVFFIDLRLPYSAVRGEQLEIKAILHNYSEEGADVTIDLIENPDVCSSASKRGKYRQKVNVGSKSTRSVPFVIIPMKEGELKIEVKAFVSNSDLPLRDGIERKLLVVPEGILKNSLKSVTFQLTKTGDKKVEVINSEILEKHLVPNTKQLTRSLISVTGREQLSALVENALSGKSMGTLIKQPSGCGEQNMISMTLPVIATVYLDKTNQWETVGLDKRAEALQHIETGYHNELAFHKDDGSFAVFPEHEIGSTWLTAYVTKVFAMASHLVGMNKDVICDAVKFLMKTQKSGMFTEVGTIIHGEMIGDVKGTDSGVSMTAFCLIAMQESGKICNGIDNLDASRNEAVSYLEKHLHGLTNPYAAAIASYALANENKLNLQILNKFKSSDHWPVRDKHLFTLEATAYALLALVKTKAFDEARPVVRWFNQQQIDGGGYGSTQATIMVYQAIAEYWVAAREEEYNVNVELFLPDRSKPPSFNFNRESHYFTRTSKVNSINNNITVVATGKGEATVKMVSWYYALPEEKESSCQKFNLSVQFFPDKIGEDEGIYKLKIEVLYKDDQRDATMAILDIGLLTGFTVNTNDLNLLSKGFGRSISKYEMDKVLSDRGSLIIYLDKVSHKRPEEIAFRMTQTLKVGILQPAPVSVYEYYDHQHNSQTPCVKFYHPQRRSGELLRLCQKNECICAEDNCNMQRKEKIDNEVRTTKACESEKGSKIDFVYKVRLEELKADLATDVYTMRVIKVIKEDSTDVAPDDKLRTFLSFPHCREALNLTQGKTYLVMGMAKDISIDTENNSFQYVLNERTWIEYWPSEEECQTAIHRPTCLGMEYLVMMQRNFGCQLK
ncbi:complement C3-like isoform X2 [Betta splendens]|uniref:Complement C3-like isoform X2 n=1 Tax=Betta splendens TaxID=158456 RepID=A0A6P7LXB1_BETSP|nr:complement C3-like isoform X2 [Betta splendens]